MHIKNPVEWFFAQFDATEEIGSAHPADYWPAARTGRAPAVREITTTDLRDALKAGLQDFAAARTDVIFLCLIYPVVGLFLAAVAAQEAVLPLLFPIASGFALVGPFFAIGLYEMSRRREISGQINWLDVFKVLRSPSIGAIFLLGGILIGLFLLWLVVAEAIYDATLGPLPPASVTGFVTSLFTTADGWAMMVSGMAAGGVFAVAVLAISVVSFPLLLDRPVGLGMAIRTSLLAVRRNPMPLALWGLIIAFGLVLGSLPCFIGLIVVLPVLGHSTWHLYRKLVKS
jgi:uncharacterized membrane protein